MNYYFTGALIVLFVLLCFIKPAHPRNEIGRAHVRTPVTSLSRMPSSA